MFRIGSHPPEVVLYVAQILYTLEKQKAEIFNTPCPKHASFGIVNMCQKSPQTENLFCFPLCPQLLWTTIPKYIVSTCNKTKGKGDKAHKQINFKVPILPLTLVLRISLFWSGSSALFFPDGLSAGTSVTRFLSFCQDL